MNTRHRDLNRVPMSKHLADRAEEFVTGGGRPVQPRNAATVVLLRDGSVGMEAYVLRRRTSMAFAGGMCAFPGGSVDDGDFDRPLRWSGPTATTWAHRLGVDERTASAIVMAAARETFEECGVLLAAASDGHSVRDASMYESDRQMLERHEQTFAAFLDKRGLTLRTELLGLWSGWLTPEFELRRYQTWFFVAQVPIGQATLELSTESSETFWLPLAETEQKMFEGAVKMLPPTYLTCSEILSFATTEAALSEGHKRDVEMFMPPAEQDPDGTWMLLLPRAAR